jgi:protoporphyrinogen IX oxidase
MLPFYIKALHIIFVVTWFAGLFYIVRLFIYNREAQDKPEPERSILQNQFAIMIRRLWFGITWPSAVLTLIFGPTTWFLLSGGTGPAMWNYLTSQPWMMLKLAFVAGLFAYHFSLHAIFKQQSRGDFKLSSTRLRIWNEVATVFLIAVVMLVVVKQGMSLVWGVVGLLAFVFVLMSAIRIYKKIREGR